MADQVKCPTCGGDKLTWLDGFWLCWDCLRVITPEGELLKANHEIKFAESEEIKEIPDGTAYACGEATCPICGKKLIFPAFPETMKIKNKCRHYKGMCGETKAIFKYLPPQIRLLPEESK